MAADGGKDEHTDGSEPGQDATHEDTSPRLGVVVLNLRTRYGTRCPFVVKVLSFDAVRKERHDWVVCACT